MSKEVIAALGRIKQRERAILCLEGELRQLQMLYVLSEDLERQRQALTRLASNSMLITFLQG